MAQPTTFQLKPPHTEDVNNETSCTSAGDLALSPTDDPGAILTILGVAPPMTGAHSVASPLQLRLFQRPALGLFLLVLYHIARKFPKPVRWDHPTAPSNPRSVAFAMGQSEEGIVIGMPII